MPHVPDSLTAHASHDPALIAAFAAGDAAGSDLDRANALVASCPECAALQHDLRAIAAALPALPVPARPRDFRLTPEQAASLRPRGLRGLLALLSGPRFSFATPLGTGLAALGLVGILVASGGFPLGMSGASSTALAPVPVQDHAAASTGEAAVAPSQAALGQPEASPAASMAAGGAAATAAPASSAAPSASVADASGAPSDGTGTGYATVESAPPSQALLAPDGTRSTGADAATAGAAGTGARDGAQTGAPALLVAAIGLLVAGLLLAGLRFGARRLA